MTDIAKVHDDMNALRAAMVDKAAVYASASLSIRCDGKISVYLTSQGSNPFKNGYLFVHGESYDAVLAASVKVIAALPDPETIGLRKYQKAIGAALDIACEESIDDKYVVGVRGAMDVLSENLLSNLEAAE